MTNARQTMTTRIPRFDLRRMAWLILTGAFMLFCSGSIIVTGTVYYYFFRSYVPIVTNVQVSRGTAGLIASDFSQQFLTTASPSIISSRDSTISTDAQSQAYVSFGIADDEPILASVTLENSTSIRLDYAARPRFNWSDGLYRIQINNFVGELDIFLANQSDRALRLIIQTPRGSEIHLTEGGRYSLQNNESRLRIATRDGRALLFYSDNEEPKLISTGEEIVLPSGRPLPIEVESPINLIENSLFTMPSTTDTTSEQPTGWACTERYDNPPDGRYLQDTHAGRQAIRFIRGSGATSGGETKCTQYFGDDDGYDLTGFNVVELQTTFMIANQSLSTCGQVGSECPLMLRLLYLDAEGNTRPEWIQGFYIRRDTTVTYPQPTICNTCPLTVVQEHRRIGEDVWYTYESGNILSQFSDTNRPVSLLSLEFYASGHQYDVYVSDIALLVGQGDIIPPNADVLPQQ